MGVSQASDLMRQLLSYLTPSRTKKNWPRAKPFQIHVVRDPVDTHDQTTPMSFTSAGVKSEFDLLIGAANHSWLPQVRGRAVVWLITSNIPLAIVEQDCRANVAKLAIRPAPSLGSLLQNADWHDDELRLRFHYNPEVSLERLYELLRIGSAA